MINMNILQVKKLEQVYLFFPRKALEKQTEWLKIKEKNKQMHEKNWKAWEKLIKSSGEKDSVNY